MPRQLQTLESLLQVPAADLKVALAYVADQVAAALHADKVDAFLYDPARDSLVALGTSNQPLSESQRRHGLDILPVSNGGRVVSVYQTGKSFLCGAVQDDPDELRGVKETLRIKSQIGVSLEVGGVRRGMLMLASLEPSFWNEEDLHFTEAVARWVGVIAHRAELTEEIARNAVEQGRRVVAEELITTMAHDLRNYLAPIEMRLALVRRRAEQDKRVSDLNDLDGAVRALRRFNGIIGDMLDVARIDQGVLRIETQPVAVVSLLEEIAQAIATPDHAIHVRAHDDMVVAVDARRLRQCVENLLSNALKYSPKDAPVTVTVTRVSRERDEVVRIEIVDEGPGIPPEVGPHIFERFVTSKRKEGGLGLGLYLAKRIAVLHGGDLVYDTKLGKGARFCLTLPLLPMRGD